MRRSCSVNYVRYGMAVARLTNSPPQDVRSAALSLPVAQILHRPWPVYALYLVMVTEDGDSSDDDQWRCC